MEKLRKFETEEIYLNEKDSLKTPIVSYTEDNDNVWIIHKYGYFYLRNEKIKFILGMTWEEFINSEYNFEVGYNMKKFYINSNGTVSSRYIDGNVRYESNDVLPTDLIVENYIYSLINVPY